MTIYQHYYTSCRHPETARTGFQVKAATPGITRSSAQMLERLISYRLPGNADPGMVAAHPVSLRYYAAGAGDAFLTCVHSSGPDEFGRPGNFFAHSLIGPAKAFNHPVPPIFYWDSPFWRREDPTDTAELPALPSLAQEVRITFSPEQAWAFLALQQPAWFYRLVCAALDYAASGRRIIIVDSSEHVALWTALLTLALPPGYRPWLTFATYHHDPYSAPFALTGTTPDTAFRSTDDDYRSYFVLNAAEDRISGAPESAYASFICDRFSQSRYNTELPDFFRLVGRHDPDPARPTPDRLTALVHFYQRGTGAGVPLSTDQAAAAARLILSDLPPDPAAASPDQAADLRIAWDILTGELLQTRNSELIPDIQKALEYLSQSDTAFHATGARACSVLAALILSRLPEADSFCALLNRAYPAEVLREALETPEVLDPLLSDLPSDDAGTLEMFWRCCGPLLTFDAATYPRLAVAFHKTCAAAQAYADEQPELDLLEPSPAVERMLTACLRTQQTVGYVTQAVLSFRQDRPDSPILEWVYYAWVAGVPLAERVQLRDLYSKTSPGLILYELRRDLLARSGDPAALAGTMAAWAAHVHPSRRQDILDEALRFCWERPELDQKAAARLILTDPALPPLLSETWLIRLMETNSDNLSISAPDAATLAVYRQLLSRPAALSPGLRAVLIGSVALATGELPPDSAPDLAGRFARLDEAVYREEAARLIRRFFAGGAPVGSHGALVAAAYTEAHHMHFWTLYWAEFDRLLLTEGQIAEAAAALDFWFTDGHNLRALHPYLLPEFFINLPEALARLRAEKAYHRIGRAFEEQIAALPWAPLVRRYLPEAGRRGFLKGLFER